MKTPTVAKRFANQFRDIDIEVQFGKISAETGRQQAQRLYDSIQKGDYEFDTHHMLVDQTLYDLGVELRPDDSLNYRESSPFCTFTRSVFVSGKLVAIVDQPSQKALSMSHHCDRVEYDFENRSTKVYY
jgi:hypothetical protein